MILTLPLDAGIIVLLMLACAGLGSRLQGFFSRPLVANFAEDFLISAGTGLFAVSYLTFALGYLGLIYRTVFLSLLLIFVWWTRKEIINFIRKFCGFSLPALSRMEKALLVVLFAAFFLNLLYNYCPPTAEDEITSHLGIPAKWIDRHAIYTLPGALAQYYPSNVLMNYTFLAAVGSVQTARLFHYMSGLFCLVAVYVLARKVLDRGTSLFACAIFYTIPIVTSLSGVGNTDFGTLLYALLSVSSFISWLLKKDRRWLVISAIFTGAHAACKYSGFPLLIILPAIIIYEERQYLLRAVKQSAIFAVISFSALVPYIVRNIIITGNPLYPKKFFHFQYGEILYLMYLKGESLFDLLKRMSDLSAGDVIWGIGPLFVAFLPFIFVFRVRDSAGRNISLLLFTIAALNYILLFMAGITVHMNRHSVISFALLSIPIAHAISQIYSVMNMRGYIVSLLSVSFLVNLSLPLYFGGKRMPVFLGLQSVRDYFDKEYDIWEQSFFVRYINDNIQKGKGILFLNTISAPQLNYPKHRVFGMDAFDKNFYLSSPADASREFDRYDIDYIVVVWESFSVDSDGIVSWKPNEGKLPIKWFKSGFVEPLITHDNVSLYRRIKPK